MSPRAVQLVDCPSAGPRANAFAWEVLAEASGGGRAALSQMSVL